MKTLVRSFAVAVVLFVSLISLADDFPIGPNPQTTPGSLCTKPTSHRYAENINYCDRNVSSQTKNSLIHMYDQQLGYHIESLKRNDFKIDHFIPLSIGGSNERDNLWPQHKSVYTITDPLEQALSDKMSAGKLKQAEAVSIVREAKLNLGRVPELLDYVNKL